MAMVERMAQGNGQTDLEDITVKDTPIPAAAPLLEVLLLLLYCRRRPANPEHIGERSDPLNTASPLPLLYGEKKRKEVRYHCI